jgi:hypothetical protein
MSPQLKLLMVITPPDAGFAAYALKALRRRTGLRRAPSSWLIATAATTIAPARKSPNPLISGGRSINRTDFDQTGG